MPKAWPTSNYIRLLRALFGQHLNISEMENSLDLTTLTVRIFSFIQLEFLLVQLVSTASRSLLMSLPSGGVVVVVKLKEKTLGTVLKYTVLITIVLMWFDVNLGLFSMENSGYAARQG